MTIAKDLVVEIEYKLTDNNGEVIDSSEGEAPLAYLHGHKNIVPGLESALNGKSKGDEFKVSLPPDQGYGQRHEGLVTQVPRKELSGVPNIEVGMQLQADTDKGVQILTVFAIDGDKVTLDGNHPLAGETLNFEIKVVNVRKATSEEISHGHVHGPGGHQH